MHISKINIPTFNFLMSSTCFEPEGSSQEDGCICSYGMVRFTCIGISSLVGRRLFSILLPTILLITIDIKRTIP